MKKISKQVTFLFFIIFFSAGCALKETQEPPKSYLIEFENDSQANLRGEKTIKIQLPQYEVQFSHSAMIYERDGAIFEYSSSVWAQKPNVSISNILKFAAESSGCFGAVLEGSSVLEGDFLIESQIEVFKQIADRGKIISVFALNARIVDRKNKKPITSKRFFYKQQGSEFSARGGVWAFEKIMEHFAKDLKDWFVSTDLK